MIRYTTGDILKADAEALINPVNCVGVMGKGLALQFKRSFPANFKAYAWICQCQQMQPGRVFTFSTGRDSNPRWVINFPTKRHWREKSRIDDIKDGLWSLQVNMISRSIRSVAVPPLGCGLGGLQWENVRLLLEKAFGDNPNVDVILYEPRQE